MTSSSRLALALVLLGLAGCATTGPVADTSLRSGDSTLALEDDTNLDLDLGADRTASGFFMAGAAALHEGRAQDAARFFDRAAELAPEEDQVYLREQAFLAAVMAGDIERAAQLAPADTASTSYGIGRLVQAVDSLARKDGAGAYALLKDGDFTTVHGRAADLLRPWAALAAGEIDAAVSQPQAAGQTPQAFAMLNRAQVLEAAGRAEEAGELYRTLSNTGAAIPALTTAYGAYLERRGMRKEAVAVYDAFLKEVPRDDAVTAARARAASRRSSPPPVITPQEGAAQAMLTAAMLSLTQREPASSVAYLRLSLRLAPNNTFAMVMAGDFLSEMGDLQGARATYARVPRGSPYFMDAQTRIVLSYQKAEDDDGALAAARRLADAVPQELAAQVLLADLLRDTKDFAGSAKVLDKVIAARGRSAEWNLYFARATSRHMAGDWPGAEQDLLKAKTLAPEEPNVLNYLGYSWADRGERLDEALTLLKTAAEREPNSGAIIDSLGWAYYRAGDYPKALENLERAVELMPAAADINDHLGDVYAKVGRTLEARFQWQRVLTLEAEDELKAQAQAKLDATPEPPPVVAAITPETAAP